MRATTLVKFDATHQVKYNPPLNCRKQFHSSQGNFTEKRSLSKMTKTFFLVELRCSRMNPPSKAPVSPSNAVSISSGGICSSPHFENNRVQLLQWLLPLYSMRKQSVYDSDWNFSYHPEPEESGHVWIIYGNRFCVRNQLVVTLDKLT